MCKQTTIGFGYRLTVDSCFERPSSSLSIRSQPDMYQHSSLRLHSRPTHRPASALTPEEMSSLKMAQRNELWSEKKDKKTLKCSDCSEIHGNGALCNQRELIGTRMSHFYNLWSRKPKTGPLGRGKTELPNSLLRQDKYRQCGCKTRHHKTMCEKSNCYTPC